MGYAERSQGRLPMRFRQCLSNSFIVTSESPEETFLVGKALGNAAYPGLLVLLKGSLGMGKTKLTQGVGHALGYERVKSPTFIIMSEYEGAVPLLHADLYRLEDEAEINSLGIEEYLEAGFTAVVEWAERWTEAPDGDRIDVEFEAAPGDGESRSLTFTGYGEAACEALRRVVEEIKTMVSAE